MDDLQSLFLSKINEVWRFANNSKVDRKSLIKHISDIIRWLISNRSLAAHRKCQALLTHFWTTFSKNHINRDDFVMDWKFWVGFTERIIIRNMKGDFVKEIETPRSLSFGKCTREEHHEFFDKTIALATKLWGFNMPEWDEEYEKRAA